LQGKEKRGRKGPGRKSNLSAVRYSKEREGEKAEGTRLAEREQKPTHKWKKAITMETFRRRVKYPGRRVKLSVHEGAISRTQKKKGAVTTRIYSHLIQESKLY